MPYAHMRKNLSRIALLALSAHLLSDTGLSLMEVDESKRYVRDDGDFNRSKGVRWPNLQERDFWFRVARFGAALLVGVGGVVLVRTTLIFIEIKLKS